MQTYNRSFMNPKSSKELRQSLKRLQSNRQEVELATEQRTGKKVLKLDVEILSQTFTPYKLRLIEQSTKMQNNALFLKNILLHKKVCGSKQG